MSTFETKPEDLRLSNLGRLGLVISQALQHPEKISSDVLMNMVSASDGLPVPMTEFHVGTVRTPDNDLVVKTFLRPGGTLVAITKNLKYHVGTSLREMHIDEAGFDQPWVDIRCHEENIRQVQFPAATRDAAYLINPESASSGRCCWADWNFPITAVARITEIKQVMFWEDEADGVDYCAIAAKDEHPEKPHAVFIFKSDKDGVHKTTLFDVIARKEHAGHKIVGIYDNHPLIWAKDDVLKGIGRLYYSSWASQTITSESPIEASAVQCTKNRLSILVQYHDFMHLIGNHPISSPTMEGTDWVTCIHGKHIYYVDLAHDGICVFDANDSSWKSDGLRYVENSEPRKLETLPNGNLILTTWNPLHKEITFWLIDGSGETRGYLSFRGRSETQVLGDYLVVYDNSGGMIMLEEAHFDKGTRKIPGRTWLPRYGIHPSEIIIYNENVRAVCPIGQDQIGIFSWPISELLNFV
jgi:hypothetical protein